MTRTTKKAKNDLDARSRHRIESKTATTAGDDYFVWRGYQPHGHPAQDESGRLVPRGRQKGAQQRGVCRVSARYKSHHGTRRRAFSNLSHGMKTGIQKGISRKHGSLETRFWRKVQKGDFCWEWAASLDRHGYGKIGVGRKGTGWMLAHVASWRIHFGDTNGLQVCHSCDNPKCVNPSHLFLGTPLDNVSDCIYKGRAFRKLDEQKVREIRSAEKSPAVFKQLAKKFGVTCGLIYNVRAGLLWKGVL